MSAEINSEHKHPKQDFQVERLAFFSDAVFAIAITLLIIEFKVPEISRTTTKEEIWQQMVKLAPNAASLLVSFYLIATYWMRHHFLFKHIHNYNNMIVVMNLVMLLPMIFLPFSTAFAANAIAADNNVVVLFAMRIFFANHILVNMSLYALYWFALVKHKEFSFRMSAKEKVKFTMDTLYQTIILVSSIIVLNTNNLNGHNTAILVTFCAVVLAKPLIKRTLTQRFEKAEALAMN